MWCIRLAGDDLLSDISDKCLDVLFESFVIFNALGHHFAEFAR